MKKGASQFGKKRFLRSASVSLANPAASETLALLRSKYIILMQPFALPKQKWDDPNEKLVIGNWVQNSGLRAVHIYKLMTTDN